MKDYLVRGIVESKNCRVFACRTTNLLEYARASHDLWPTASAALGRMMSVTLMMGAMNKNKEKMTVTINGGGPIVTLLASTNLTSISICIPEALYKTIKLRARAAKSPPMRGMSI